MIEDLYMLLSGAALACLIAVPYLGIRMETKAYNGGKCPECKTRWRQYDVDSQGGRGYTCDTCPRGCWVSYNRVDGT